MQQKFQQKKKKQVPTNESNSNLWAQHKYSGVELVIEKLKVNLVPAVTKAALFSRKSNQKTAAHALSAMWLGQITLSFLNLTFIHFKKEIISVLLLQSAVLRSKWNNMYGNATYKFKALSELCRPGRCSSAVEHDP